MPRQHRGPGRVHKRAVMTHLAADDYEMLVVLAEDADRSATAQARVILRAGICRMYEEHVAGKFDEITVIGAESGNLKRALQLAVDTIEAHAVDWNSDKPRDRTDVTCVLPELRAALDKPEEAEPDGDV